MRRRANSRAKIRLPLRSLHVPLYKLMPNIVTILGLCVGITSIRYALDEKWTMAVGLIVIAAILDGIDGRLARLLNSTSKFGAELDSLVDVINFGVAPALINYLWLLHEIPYKGVGWAIVLIYLACATIRLARFNSNLDDVEAKKTSQNFFTGVPITAASVLSLCPLIITFEIYPYKICYWLVALYLPLIGLLMVSRLPTFSFKTVIIPRIYISFFFVGIALVIAATLLEPWLTLPFLGLVYFCTMPLSALSYYKMRKAVANKLADGGTAKTHQE